MVSGALLAVACLLTTGIHPARGASGQFNLTITLTGEGTGTVVSADGTINCVRESGTTTGTCTGQWSIATPSMKITAAPTMGTYVCDSTTCYAEALDVDYVIPGGPAQTWSGYFGLSSRYINVLKTGSGKGSVTSQDGQINCPATCSSVPPAGYAFGAETTLVAAASSGSKFKAWTGACAGQGATCHVTMNAPEQTTETTVEFALVPRPTPTARATATAKPTATVTPAATPDPAGTPAPTAELGATEFPTMSAESGASSNLPTREPGTPGASAGAGAGSSSGSLETGWVAFLVLLVLVIGLGLGGLIAALAMRRRAPPRS